MEDVTLAQLAQATGGVLLGDAHPFTPVSTVCYDTRELQAGDVFLPLVGERADGHMFIDQALKKGAAAVFTARKPADLAPGKGYILVEDTADVPRALAAWYRARFAIPFVSITGSVGKTTTKDMVVAVLSEKFSVHKTPGNHNNTLGVPMALLDLTAEHQVSVIEMGMNHTGEIDFISALVKPRLALITNIGDAHIENLGSREGILAAKAEVFAHMDDDGLAILNGDDELLMTLKGKLKQKIVTCGASPYNDYYVTDLDRDLATDVLHCVLHTPKATAELTIPAVGDYMIYPVLMAAAVGEQLGMTGEEIARGVLRYAPTKMRMNVIDRGAQVRILDDSYNANPQSMRAGLQTLASTQRDFKIAILGDMLELGPLGPGMHAMIGQIIAENHINCLVAIGELARHTAQAAEDAQVPQVYWFETKEEALPTIAKLVEPGSAILVKASRRMAFEEIVQYLVSITPEKEQPTP